MRLLISIITFIVTTISIGYDQPIIALAGILVLIWQEMKWTDLA